jgi:ABC-type Zn uptake system ZnuABC Zn-binding protein ZnuA/ABC-type Mn2+/Zn2+ transport system permease subunit
LFDVFSLPFVQRGLIQVLLLAVACGLLGTWIVLRGLAFYAHAVAAASFPGLVLAGGLGFAAPLGAFAVGGAFAATVGQLSARDQRTGYDSATALALVAALAAGVILASDVFHSGSQVDSLLFGSLLVIDSGDQVLAAVTAALAVAGTWVLGTRWLATGFDAPAARAIGVRSTRSDLLLLALVALAAVSSLAAVGALLAGALLVIPAATTRLWTERLRTWQIASVLLAGAEGVVGLWISVEVNAPPGAAIAVLAAAVFALTPVVRMLIRVPGALPAAATLALLVSLAGCGSSSNGKPVVVATTTQIGDFARAVGGDAIDVHQILRPNTDPHEYEPRPDDIRATADAAVVLENGDGLDAWMKDVVKQAGGHPNVVTLGEVARTQLPGEASGAEASRVDPHWWHDPRNAEAAVERVRSALGQALPKDKQAFDRRAAAYVNRIDALDQRIAHCFASIPASERKLVTSHDAFNYFAKRYGIDVVGAIIPSQTTEAQPSAGDIAKLVQQVRREHVRAIFLETSVNPKLGKAVAAQTGAVANLRLYGDTLGPAGSPGATYLGMELANANAMMRGFTGGKRGCA